MVAAMRDDQQKGRPTIFLNYARFQRGIKDRRYKLIEVYADEQRSTQLFDWQDDPWEMHNLADLPEQQERIKAMRTELVALAREWNDFESEWGKAFWPKMEFYSA